MIKLFIDFDNTIVDTTTAAISTYNELKGLNIDPSIIENYDMTPYVDLEEKERSNLFCNPLLYKKLVAYDNVFSILYRLKSSGLFEIYLVTNCSSNSIPYKIKWLKDNNFDFLFDGKFYLDIGRGYNKSMINMENSIFIDDHRENHLTSNAKYKLSFKYNDKQKWGPEPQDNVIVFKEWNNGIYSYLKHIAESHSGKYNLCQ